MTTTLRRPVGTLFGAPTYSPSHPGRLAVLGVPFDMGAHPNRIGARSGPTHVRTNSLLVAEHMGEYALDLVAELDVVDWGDADVEPGQVDTAFGIIEQTVSQILSSGATPLTFGGDGAVSLPILRALHAANNGPFALIHFDAHTDAFPRFSPHHFNNGNTFIHALDEGLLDPSTSTHIGMRDAELPTSEGVIGSTRELGYEVVTMSQIIEMGAQKLGSYLREKYEGIPVYLCWDMDVFDPSVAPGVVTPSWGGLTTREGLSIIRSLRGLNFVAFDINTVSPPHDPSGVTGALAAQIAMECLYLFRAQPQAAL